LASISKLNIIRYNNHCGLPIRLCLSSSVKRSFLLLWWHIGFAVIPEG
jgi:hypothetical protein